MTSTADVVVIGAGIVGLALADAMLAARPGSSVVVLDKEHRLGAHASGRNSGVLHAGFYYSPDSLKARLTRRGNILLHEFCDQHGVPVRRCGKLVVAQRPEDLPALDELLRRAALNGVPVEAVDEEQARELEPLARTVERALWSPTTSSASPIAVVDALATRVRDRGGEVVLGSRVVTARDGAVVTPDRAWSVGHVVNAAGLQADRVARWFGMCDDYAVLPFKGRYWYGDRGRWPPGRLRRHVYPVPDPRNPFLGVHITMTVDGRAKIGPTALPALWRESYGGLHGLAPADVADVVLQLPRFLTSRQHDVPALLRSELPAYWRPHLVRQAARMVPSVSPRDFRESGLPGVRAQLFHLADKRLEMDFVVRGDDHSTHVLNAVSPAWTSSLAFAEHVVATRMPT
ncbi:MAG TPA: L-2-hydroxyglutarate oxidase [Actinomycetes bacterium]|nr:L-2-hydroxyglutarate oxidase [Actinomycetes bacterium]